MKKKVRNPEWLWEAFKEYCVQTKNTPFEITDWVGGIAKEVTRKKEKPLTFEGFENYCDSIGMIADLGHYVANSRNAYDDYQPVLQRIRRHIRQDQIEGGVAGVYQHAIVARINGLVEKTENKHEVTEIKIVES